MNPAMTMRATTTSPMPAAITLAFVSTHGSCPNYRRPAPARRQRVATEASWLAWREQARRGDLAHLSVDLAHTSPKVRCPAEGMAYVFAPRLDLEGDAVVMTLDPTELDGSVITLLLEGEEWRVHSSGDIVDPIDLGLSADSGSRGIGPTDPRP